MPSKGTYSSQNWKRSISHDRKKATNICYLSLQEKNRGVDKKKQCLIIAKQILL